MHKLVIVGSLLNPYRTACKPAAVPIESIESPCEIIKYPDGVPFGMSSYGFSIEAAAPDARRALRFLSMASLGSWGQSSPKGSQQG